MNEKYDLCDIDESYLHTVSMTELFDSAYQSKPPIIDGLLYRGTYLFAGSPKIGKSFLMFRTYGTAVSAISDSCLPEQGTAPYPAAHQSPTALCLC